MKKLNCWEFKKCGREPGGTKANEMGVCPSAIDPRLHGAHGGTNAGRACWVVAGTMCRGEIQGTFAMKYLSCLECDFYFKVMEEEAADFILSRKLIAMLNRAELNP